MRAWIEADREALRVHRRLGQTAEEWEEHDWEESFLYQDARLTEAEEWAQAHRADLNELEQAFVHACVEQRDREAREAEERRQSELARSRRWTLGLGAALLLAIAFLAGAVWFGKRAADNATLLGTAQETAVVAGQTAVFEATRALGAEKSEERERDKAQAESTRAFHARETAVAEAERADAERAEAERQQAIAEARSLAAYAEGVGDQNPELAILLGIESVRRTHEHLTSTMTSESVDALQHALARSRRRVTLQSGHSGSVYHAAWDGQGTRIVTAGGDGAARIYWVSAPALIDLACSRVNRNLSHGEWKRHVGQDRPYSVTCPGLPVPQ